MAATEVPETMVGLEAYTLKVPAEMIRILVKVAIPEAVF